MSVVLSLFDYSGVMVRPWAEAGYECVCVDIQHAFRREGNVSFVGCNVATFQAPPALIVFAFPPCDDLAVSGARWFTDKGLEGLHHALGLVVAAKQICEASGAPWFIENPVSTLSTYWRKPDHMFDPCDYGDPYTKKTCLWSGGGFVMPPKCPVPATDGSRMHLMAPSPERKNMRSKTPEGFARAVFAANAPMLAVS